MGNGPLDAAKRSIVAVLGSFFIIPSLLLHASQILFQNLYPELTIDGDNYLPTGSTVAIASTLSMISWSLIFVLLFGDYVFLYLDCNPPDIYRQATQNKSLLATGAFEIYLDGDLIHSKLATNRLPSWPELIDAIDHILS
eukprot:gene9140-1435_t